MVDFKKHALNNSLTKTQSLAVFASLHCAKPWYLLWSFPTRLVEIGQKVFPIQPCFRDILKGDRHTCKGVLKESLKDLLFLTNPTHNV